MGKIFLEHSNGVKLYSCAACDTNLTNKGHLISTRFTGATGRAYLFKYVVNLTYSNVQDRVMLTGRHMVRDVMCKNCEAKLGWMYEFATEENQRYKEGKVILEHALITESEGFQDSPATPSRNNYEQKDQEAYVAEDVSVEEVVWTMANNLEKSSTTNSSEIMAIAAEVKNLCKAPKKIQPISLASTPSPGTVSTLSSPSPENEYKRDEYPMDAFISAIRETSGGGCVEVSMESVETDLRQHLEFAITSLLATLQPVRPGAFAALNAIDWRSLFRIEPQPPVDIVVQVASEDDSGGGGSLADTT